MFNTSADSTTQAKCLSCCHPKHTHAYAQRLF